MKLTVMIALVIILPFTKANSQITKGNWMVGGNIGFSSAKTSDVNSTSFSYPSVNVFQVRPNVGYFLFDKFSSGLLLNYSHQSLADNNTSIGYKSYQIQAGPFARYYFLPSEKMANIFFQASYQYGKAHTESNSGINGTGFTTNTFSFLAGPVIYFNSSVGIEFTLGFNTEKQSGLGNPPINYDVINSFQIGIGFQIHLEKK